MPGSALGDVDEYDATTGAAIHANFIGTYRPILGLALSGNNLFLSNSAGFSTSAVGEYNATTGAAINANFISGLDGPMGLALSGNNLFVAISAIVFGTN